MRFMLLQNYGEAESECAPMSEWEPADVKAHIEFQQALNAELAERGELVDAQGLAGPGRAKFVVSDGTGAPVITDGPYPESKELLAGYRLIDVESAERAIQIAARASAAPGPAGMPIKQPIEVREVLSAPEGVTGMASTEDLLRTLAPRVLGAVCRRYGDFSDAEDAVQEALIAAVDSWPEKGRPDDPLAWLVRVASRRLGNHYRSEDARRRREELAAAWSLTPAEPVPDRDDTLACMFMCCHPSLTPATAIPLTLRAVGGLTTREIAAAFLVTEATMAQRISRAKARIKESGERFALPPPGQRPERLRSVLHVLYLLFNEGYTSSGGPGLARADLSGEAIRLARGLRSAVPGDPEVAGLLALMLLTEARRPARSGPDGELIPLAGQDRTLWDRRLIAKGTAIVADALRQGTAGEYRLQAAITALHDHSPSHAGTDWPKILTLYERLEALTGNPMVRLNRAVAAAMVHGPAAGFALLDTLGERLGDHHRLHAVRAHLLEMTGDRQAAAAAFRAAAASATNLRERHYLTTKAARLSHPRA